MEKYINFAILFLCFLTLKSCNLETSSTSINDRYKDEFYNLSSTKSYLPLIKPYDAVCTEETWEVNLLLDSLQCYSNVYGIKDISIFKNIIYFRTEDNGLGCSNQPKFTLFMIHTENNIEIGFSTENELLNYIEKKQFPRPHWTDIMSVWKDFKKTNILPWEKSLGLKRS